MQDYMKRSPVATPTLSDVARLAGVGKGTASRVLNGGENCSKEAIRRVEEAILELGFTPNRLARSLKGGASGSIGMIVPSISDMFFSQCAEAVEKVAKANGSLLIVMASHDDPAVELNNLEHLLLHRVDGLILAAAQSNNARLYKELKELKIPVVGLDRPLQQAKLSSFVSQNREGAIAGTEHLLSHGYDKILCIHVKPELYTIRERLQGYKEAVSTAGQEPLHKNVGSAADVARYLMEHRGPAGSKIAVFAANNLAARLTWGAIRTLRLSIPKQIGILSFDDFDLADSLTPPMSVVQQTVDDLGRKAAELLFQKMKNPQIEASDKNDPLYLPTRLIIRQSCGCKSPIEVAGRRSTFVR
jgi:LacI family transcriptional regulator